MGERRPLLAVLVAVCLQAVCCGSVTTSLGPWPLRAQSSAASRWHARLALRGAGESGEQSGTQMQVDTAQPDDAHVSGAVDVTIKWKLATFPLRVDTGQSADVLKYQLYSMTQVPPEEQFLIGIYEPGQDADLKECDLKDEQTLILLGEPARVLPPPRVPTGEADAAAANAPSRHSRVVSDAEDCRMDIDDHVDHSAPPDAQVNDEGTSAHSAILPRASQSSEPMAKRGYFSFVSRLDHIKHLHELQDNTTGLDNPEEMARQLNATHLLSQNGIFIGSARLRAFFVW